MRQDIWRGAYDGKSDLEELDLVLVPAVNEKKGRRMTKKIPPESEEPLAESAAKLSCRLRLCCVVLCDMNENEHVSSGRRIRAVQQENDLNESTDLIQMLLVLCCVYKPKEGFESVLCLTHWLLFQVAKTYDHSNI